MTRLQFLGGFLADGHPQAQSAVLKLSVDALRVNRVGKVHDFDDVLTARANHQIARRHMYFDVVGVDVVHADQHFDIRTFSVQFDARVPDEFLLGLPPVVEHARLTVLLVQLVRTLADGVIEPIQLTCDRR
jgi:hypothetical protein